ncbi:probable serine/threonine-protein kinase PBL28 [Anneissia japonica]|uniref:probable serine/threonine-protein kinase PBL28 n=1 Tax=Anneissia japonica TaxID=1529436 RepID=UPI00142597A3|nr:probable serine/threonine-protein kinase PBL28 [Anneissia japonica]
MSKWLKESRGQPITVAIKEYNEDIAKGSKQGDEQFQKELSAVEISKHCFAVTVLGFCSDQKYKALVYPYMKKGDLKKLLDNHSPDLTWKVRLRILHQIARVMCHFHNSFALRKGASFVHGDVKADNIFVDEHLNAFLGDFGVMEELPDGRTSITRNLQAHAMGYKDPDAVKQFSKSSDVFMFGVVMFRCITSLPAQQGTEPPECESLASSRQRDIEENCGDLYKKVDKVILRF